MAETLDVAFTVNGATKRLRLRTDQRLLDVLRDDLRLTGAKEGCGKGECGSCTVIVDGRAVVSCLMLGYQADGTVVETIEGLAQGGDLHPLQDAFIEAGGVQCGICIPGMVMAGKALLDRKERPTPADVREGLAGNLCRCTGYTKIFDAVALATGKPSPAARAYPPEPAAPSYYRPRSLEEALEILVQRGGDVRPLAGGTDTLVEAKDGKLDRARLFDLTAVPELSGIEEDDEHVRIGATATHTEMMASPLLHRYAPALPIGCSWVGGPQIRNRGTLGGNLAHGSPGGRHHSRPLRGRRRRPGGLGLGAARRAHRRVLHGSAQDGARARRADPGGQGQEAAGSARGLPAPGPEAGPGHLQGLGGGGPHLQGGPAGLGPRGPGRGRAHGDPGAPHRGGPPRRRLRRAQEGHRGGAGGSPAHRRPALDPRRIAGP